MSSDPRSLRSVIASSMPLAFSDALDVADLYIASGAVSKDGYVVTDEELILSGVGALEVSLDLTPFMFMAMKKLWASDASIPSEIDALRKREDFLESLEKRAMDRLRPIDSEAASLGEGEDGICIDCASIEANVNGLNAVQKLRLRFLSDVLGRAPCRDPYGVVASNVEFVLTGRKPEAA